MGDTAEPRSHEGASAEIDWTSLARPEAYPGDPSARFGVEEIQTHISRVFLTRERVYKFRKPVDLDFVCFRSRAQRNADCLREVTLNRRLARDVYLGVAPLEHGESGARIGPVAETLPAGPGPSPAEHCVVMRRLPAGFDALTLLSKRQLGREAIERTAERIAHFHRDHGLGVPAPFTPEEWREVCVEPVEANFRALARADLGAREAGLTERARARVREVAERLGDRFERRRRAGRAVDGHGDLHLEHVWFGRDGGGPWIIDCLEFSDALRRIDAACDVAFLAMDLHYRGAPQLAEGLLRRYAREMDDFDLYGVVDFFASYRAGVRAKVAAIAARDPAIERDQARRAAGSVLRHLELTERLLRPRSSGRLVLVGGVIGTGKSRVAEALAEAHGGVVISSDRVRKRLLGVAATERLRAGWRQDAYAPEVTDRVYDALLERARPVVESGRTAFLDATFARRVDREKARRWAAENGIPSFFVEVRCERAIVLARLARRAATGGDPSDAGPELYRQSAAAFEPVEEWPPENHEVLRTETRSWRSRIAALGLGARARAPSRT
ncbi:MAG: AAA family ATPase [Myxococcota bacterium]